MLNPSAQRNVLTRLTRLVQSKPERKYLLEAALDGRVEELAQVAISVARETGDPIGEVLADILRTRAHYGILPGIYEKLDDQNVPLRELALVVNQQLLDRYRSAEETENLHRIANLQNDLSSRFAALGRRQQSLAAAQEAVVLFRSLVEQQPQAGRGGLATALANLAAQLSEMGSLRPALDKAALLNLAANCRQHGQHAGAVEITREAVDLYEGLAMKYPERFNWELAAGLSNLSAMLWQLGEHEAAAAAARESTDYYRKLVAKEPAAYLRDHAAALVSLAIVCHALGHYPEAVASALEAIDSYRDLANSNPARFDPELATALGNLAPMLGSAGRHQESLEAAQEAVAIWRSRSSLPPEEGQSFATALNNLSNCLSTAGKLQESIVRAREAVANCRALAVERPAALKPTLAMTLATMASRLAESGRQEEALAASEEASKLYRELFEVSERAFRHNLAAVLHNLAGQYQGAGRLLAAAEASQEALQLYCKLVEEAPRADTAGLDMALTRLQDILDTLAATPGHEKAVLRLARETVALLSCSEILSPQLTRILASDGAVVGLPLSSVNGDLLGN